MDLYDGGVEPQGPAQSVLATPGTDDKYAHPTIVAAVGRLPFSGVGERQGGGAEDVTQSRTGLGEVGYAGVQLG
ncbi:hypothetical protein Misp03_24950 [Microbispora sp. NBRC 16548]|nr:hypothetical protein Misp03_24950 [Microbispora sp. NBRC 16548]